MGIDKPSEIASRFSAGARLRGAEYFHAGRVLLDRVTPSAITARVRGNTMYSVRISRGDRGELRGFCTCAGFKDLGPCMHLWAATLASRTRGSKWMDQGLEGEEVLAVAPPESGEQVLRSALPLPKPEEWQRRLAGLLASSEAPLPLPKKTRLQQELHYALFLQWTRGDTELPLRVVTRRRMKNGQWTQPQDFRPEPFDDLSEWSSQDRRIIALLRGASSEVGSVRRPSSEFKLDAEQSAALLPLMAATGRLFAWRELEPDDVPLSFDAGEPWRFAFTLGRDPADTGIAVSGVARQGELEIDLSAVAPLGSTGFALHGYSILRIDRRGSELARVLAHGGPLRANASDEERLVGAVLASCGPELPEIRGLECAPPETPRPRLVFGAERSMLADARLVPARLSFEYGAKRFACSDATAAWISAPPSGVSVRALDVERALAAELLACTGVTSSGGAEGADLWVDPEYLPGLVRDLVARDWLVEGEQGRYRSPGSFSASVRSGIDWFELEGGLAFDDQVAPLPALLAAAREKRSTVVLGDGSIGVLPEHWLQRLELLGSAHIGGDTVQFRRNQGVWLEAWLASEENVASDAGFAALRSKVSSFRGIEPRNEPPGFRGELRPYQRDGLGWLAFLRELSLGGCLADDMGLGKTVQVLAMLAEEPSAATGARRKPSLVVAPKSLTFNWISEAKRFAPHLRLLDYTGAEREISAAEIGQTDLVVTTYGTLRSDIHRLRTIEFDWAILDEAQAIKNESTQVARAARLLHAEHRLALSGTPIENHLGELWSLFEFLNPGMLGTSATFRRLAAGRNEAPSGELRELLTRALRPFLLRRTKEQVLRDLPTKTEQVLYCDLTGTQRREYDELRDHYRRALLSSTAERGRVDPIQVLEALLRLRQMACHPGLIDPARQGDECAKFELLLPLIDEVREGGHKALVFSQFSSLLDLVRTRLDQRGVTYAQLDGRTTRRAEQVERFQTESTCDVFLITLKAGGYGLNLTAADYVFVLDPWWNPAAEAQAVDRAHRIGQTRPVMAYRLIARDTVEERVLALQAQKRELADSVLGAGTAPLADLTREDLALLLA